MGESNKDRQSVARMGEFQQWKESLESKFDEEHFKTIGVGFNIAFCVLASIALILNLVVLYVIVSHRRQTFKSVFYTLLANVAITDAIRAACMLVWAVEVLSTDRTGDINFLYYALYALRFFNMLTILNIVLLTLNEFLAIRYPVRYKRYDSPGVATLLPVLISWALAFVATALFAWKRGSRPDTLLVRTSIDESNDINESDVKSIDPQLAQDNWCDGVELGILLFAISCFLLVIVCYAWFIQKLRQRSQDAKFRSDTPILRIHFGGQSKYTEVDANTSTCRAILRHKYIIVIGMVVVVYSFYLVSYAAITLLQYAADNKSRFTSKYLTTRLCLQLAVILHTILQPLCYLRFRQFSTMTLKTFSYSPTRTGSRYSTRSTSIRRTDVGTQVSFK